MSTEPNSPQKRLASVEAACAVSDQRVEQVTSDPRGQALKFMLLQFVWAFVSATVGLYFLANAPSNAEINVWAMRVLMVFGVGISGSLAIQIAWMGRGNIATFKFWGSWFAVNMLCSIVAIPIAMALVPI